ncbi:MATE family efflux transporter [Oceanospirillum sp. D5]|uniref:MATE family efflux transporter n=2 Tax=Oceanospirillum sediminis TaxID=2760088 RepID=A0A839IQR2_9GAMM|nr:MATE family efflux transporter [Oceanospirillum sediminis]
MTWPMLIGILAIMSNQLVDSAFIGQLGALPLAAVGFSIPVYQLIIGIQVGLGIATTTVISMAMGAGKADYAKQLGSLVLSTGFILILLLCLALWFHQETLLFYMGANEELYPLVRDYWIPWLLSAWLGAILYFGYSIFRANGETFLPGMVMVITSVLNMILDPLFIFTFGMGLPGAAWATVVAFIVGGIIIFRGIFARDLIAVPESIRVIFTGLRRLFSFMAPAMMSQFIPPISAMVATSIVAVYGDHAIAAWGLGTRIEFFSIIVVLALTMAMPPMIGRLRGSKEIEKIHQLVLMATGFVLIWQLILAALVATGSSLISNLLTSDETIASLLESYLWLVPVSYAALGVCMLMVSACSAMGMPNLALGISALRLLACYLPLLWIGSELSGLNGLFVGAMAGNMMAGIVSWWMYKRHYLRLKAETGASPDQVACNPD